MSTTTTKTPTYTVSCTQKKLIAPNVYELKFSKPEGFDFVPGQFILFDVPLITDLQDLQARAYSIASTPQDEELLFAIKLVPNGRASMWVENHMDAGSQIVMKGPFGAFTLNQETKKNYLFIATGTGVAPMYSQIKWALETANDTRKMDLVFGVLTEEDLFWEAEFRALEDAYPNFTAHASYLKGGADWHGNSGSVQERVESMIDDFSQVSVYLCGAPDIVKEMKERCLTEWQVPKDDLHQEAFV